VEGEKKMGGTVTGFCYSSGPVKVHEREVGTVTGLYGYGALLHTGSTVHTGWILFTGSVLFWSGYYT
jgi:hypothetical protein